MVYPHIGQCGDIIWDLMNHVVAVTLWSSLYVEIVIESNGSNKINVSDNGVAEDQIDN